MKRLFVTGGHGFVGQWIQRRAPGIAELHGFELALPPPDFELLEPAQLDAQLSAARPNAILHLAAQSNVPQSFKNPEGTFRVNAIGTLRLLEGLKRAGLSPRIVCASTGDVYGEATEDTGRASAKSWGWNWPIGRANRAGGNSWSRSRPAA